MKLLCGFISFSLHRTALSLIYFRAGSTIAIHFMSRFELREVGSRKDFDAVINVVWLAQYDPYRPMFQVFFPVLGPRGQDRQEAIQESKERLWNAHCKNPSSHWFCVQDCGGDTVANRSRRFSPHGPIVPNRSNLVAGGRGSRLLYRGHSADLCATASILIWHICGYVFSA